jgi:hypothetical protein
MLAGGSTKFTANQTGSWRRLGSSGVSFLGNVLA